MNNTNAVYPNRNNRKQKPSFRHKSIDDTFIYKSVKIRQICSFQPIYKKKKKKKKPETSKEETLCSAFSDYSNQ